MYDNPFYKAMIQQWGWNRENLFACLMDCWYQALPSAAIPS